MGFVFYDVETTGLDPAFDQIVEFAAIRTDDLLKPVDRARVELRLLPHVLPSPEALCVTGTAIETLVSSDRPSFFEGMGLIAQTLRQWSPSAIIGYNSTRFDERFLHHGFYQALHPAYLTSRHQNSRGDALRLARAVAALRPDALKAGVGANGEPSFRLEHLCAANGYTAGTPHQAMADTEGLLWLCRLIADKAPDLWSQFMRFTNKGAARDFLQGEEAVILFDPRGNDPGIRYLTWLGASEKDGNRHFCLDLLADIQGLAQLDESTLAAALSGNGSPLRRVRINGSPLMMPLYEVDALAGAPDESHLTAQAATVRAQPRLADRLLKAARASETDYPPSPHVESQLYGGFISFAEEDKMAAFHAADWNSRAGVVGTFSDRRLVQLGRRILFYERPDLLDAATLQKMGSGLAQRLRSPGDGSVPWLTLDGARTATDRRLAQEPASIGILASYREYIGRLSLDSA